VTQKGPEGAVSWAESGLFDLALSNQNLLAEGQVFEQEVVLGTQEIPEIV